MFKNSIRLLIVSFWLGMVFGLSAFAAGGVDPTFNPFLADTLGVIQESVVQPDGKILIRGDFEALDGKVRPFLSRLNADGTLDTSFNPVISKYVSTASGGSIENNPIVKIDLQSDGKILVAGKFSFQGVDRALIRLNPDGSSDDAFNNQPDVLSFSRILSFDIFPDNKIIFSGLNPSSVWKTVMMNSDGTISSQITGINHKFFIQPDGKIIVFRVLIGVAFQMTRLEQSLATDSSFMGSSAGYKDLDLQPDQKVVVGGSFVVLAGMNINKVARFTSDGNLDPTFNTSNLINMNGDVCKVAVLPSGKILIAGTFTQIGMVQANKIARLNSDGTLDNTFNATAPALLEGDIMDFDVLSNGQIIVPVHSIYRLNADGSLDNTFHSPIVGKPGDGKDSDVQSDGKVVAVGQFTNVNGMLVDRIVRFNTDGTVDTSFNPVIPANSGNANTVRIQSDGKIIVGFQHNRAIRYNSNGTTDLEFPSVNFDVNIVEVAPNGTVYLGGLQVYFLKSYTPAGVLISNQLSPNQPLSDLKAQPDSKLLFSFYSSNFLRRVNANGAALDPGFNAPTLNSVPYSIAVQADGKILIGGDFTNVGGTVRFYIARLNADGSHDTSFTPTVLTEKVRNIALQPDGKILVQTLQEVGSVVAFSTVRRLNADGSNDTSFQPVTTNNHIKELTVTSNNTAVITGDFTRVNGIPKLGIARINIAPAKTLFDYDGDGRADISVFRPSTGVWYLSRSTAGFYGVQFGLDTDRLVPEDYDGDGKTDVAVWRPSSGVWYVLRSSDNSLAAYQWGTNGDIPLPGDFDGDGKADINVFRPSDGYWYRLNSSDNQFVANHFGTSGDIPLAGDFNGDGKADLAVYRPSSGYWIIARPTGIPSQNFDTVVFGLSTDIPAPADFDGDGKTDINVYRRSNGFWYRLNSSNGQYVENHFGVSEDIPVAADFNGDGKADLAVYRPSGGYWFIAKPCGVPAQNFDVVQFGTATDKPTPAAFVP